MLDITPLEGLFLGLWLATILAALGLLRVGGQAHRHRHLLLLLLAVIAPPVALPLVVWRVIIELRARRTPAVDS